MKVTVIGTGLSSYFLVLGLIENGIKPEVYDIGDIPETDTVTLCQKVSQESLKYKFFNFNKEKYLDILPDKNYFGDSFSYSDFQKDKIKSSKSFGGFSNIWGGTLEKMKDSEFKNYPFTYDTFNKFYLKVEEILKSHKYYFNSNELDEKEYKKYFGKLSNDLYSDYNQNIENKTLKNFTIKKSILALNYSSCYKCNLCLTGCPDNYIFDTSKLFLNLNKQKKITLNLGCKLINFNKIDEKNTNLLFEKNKSYFQYETNYLFISCGPIQTAKILINSKPDFYDSFEFLDIQKYFTIFSKIPSYKYSLNENKITLSSIFLNFKEYSSNNEIYDNYFQVSTINNLILSKLNLLDKQKFSLIRNFLGFFLSSQLYLWGALDSNLSGKIIMNYKNQEFSIKKTNNSLTRITIYKNLKKIKKILKLFNFYYLPFSTIIPDVGNGNHFGSNMPMIKNPSNNYQTDEYGRILNHKNISIVDASILPKISSNTISHTLMANAYRIGLDFKKYNSI